MKKKRRRKMNAISEESSTLKKEMASITISQRKMKMFQEPDLTTTCPINKFKETQHLLGWKTTTDNSRISAASKCLP